ncbi:MAG TPA: dihydrolipoamide acetyltransferase family protein [Anaeromyxobacteraceae bacterium]|nr:dihydrolipoamide acetyltransferase family protein [Anaeromyxobacteraceae bacterium]
MAYQLELPDIGEGVVEAEVQKWFVKPGDLVLEDQPLVEVMTDKATVVIPSPRRGRVIRLFCEEGQVAKVHAPLVELEVEAGAAAVPAAPAAAAPRAPRPAPGGPAGAVALGPQRLTGAKALAAPAVRALAREMGVDINAVRGTGPDGRVTKEDVSAHRGGANGGGAGPAPARAAAAGPATQSAKGEATSPDEERIPLRGLRRRIAENMARSKRTAAHFTFVEQADVTELVKLKERMAAAASAEGVKLTFLPFVVKAVVAALRHHPDLNASLDEERQEIVRRRRYDIGVASATDAGLVVPVIRGADRRSLLDVAREIARLAQATKAGQVRPEDLGRSTFTITSLGALGGLFATPVINYPEVAILGLHRIRPTPVARDGQVVVRDVMHVSLTSDHRVVDGQRAAAFCYEVIRSLEDPALLFMNMA